MTNVTMLARDRYRLTKQAIESLVNDMRSMSFLVVDDRSQPLTADLLHLYGAVRNETPMGTGPLRNLAVAESEKRYGRGDYLYLSDNDVFFRPTWLAHLIHCYELTWSSGIRVLGACNHPFHQPVTSLPMGNGSAVMVVNALASQSMLMRWEVWDTFGPFCETPVDKVCQSEDVDFTNKIRAAGFKIGVVSPALIVNTGITNSFGEHIPGWEMVKRQCPIGVICE